MVIGSRDLRLAVLMLLLGAAALSGACASSGAVAVPRPFPTPGGATPPAAPMPGTPHAPGGHADGYAISTAALALKGTPYRNGGTDPHGFDCSGFTQYVFAEYGIELPREVRDQFRVGKNVKPRNVEPGDLLFFSTVAPGASHVAIAIGGDQFVHAPSSTGVVRVERLSTTYWSRRFIGARRVN